MNADQEMLIARQCERLAIAFAHAVDHRDTERAVAVFAPDATFERRGEVLRGHGEIRAAQQARAPGIVTRHLCSTIDIQVLDHRHARGTVYFLLYRHESAAPGGGPAPLGQPETLGEYQDEYILSDGGWRIARRVAKAAFRRSAG